MYNCQSHSYTHLNAVRTDAVKHTRLHAYTHMHTQTLNPGLSLTLGSLNQEQKSPALNQEFLGSNRTMSYRSLVLKLQMTEK